MILSGNLGIDIIGILFIVFCYVVSIATFIETFRK
jgi:hypothetical protein